MERSHEILCLRFQTKRLLACDVLGLCSAARLLCCDDPAMKTTEELYSHQQVRFFPKGGDDDDRKLEPGTHEGREDLLITSFFFPTAVFFQI